MRHFLFIFFVLITSTTFSQDTVYYEIKKEENIYKVSKIYDVEISDLLKLNNLSDSIVIPGQIIKVYREEALSEKQLKLNKSIYTKELLEKKETDNTINLDARLKEIAILKEKLDENNAVDIQRILNLSREKKELKDSVRTENLAIRKDVRSLESEIELLEIEIASEKKSKVKKVKKKAPPKEDKPKEPAQKEIENEQEDKKPTEKEKVLAKKKLEKEKAERDKQVQLAIQEKQKQEELAKKSELSKIEKNKSSRFIKKEKDQKEKKIISSQVVVDDKITNEANNTEKKSKAVKKKKDIAKTQKNKERILVDITKSIDSLKLQKKNNEIFLDIKLKEIENKKAKLDLDTELQEILNLSKEKFLVSDSINKKNKTITNLIKDKEFEIESQGLVESKKAKPEKVKKSKKVTLELESLGFDNENNIDTSTLSKSELEDFKNALNNEEKDTISEASMTRNVETANVKKSKKRQKYVFGDEVDKNLKEKAKFFLARAKGEIDNRNITKAKEFIDKSLALNPSYIEAYTLKGDVFSSFSYFDKALNQYKKASILSPKDAQLHYNIGNCYIRMDKDDLAIEEWTKAIKLDDKYILAYAGRASLFMKNKKFKHALADYDKIFAINKYFYVAYKGRGVAHLELGNFGKAIIDFNNFLEFEADDAYIYWKRGLAKLYDNEIYGGCMDLLSSSEFGNKEATRALKKHCEK